MKSFDETFLLSQLLLLRVLCDLYSQGSRNTSQSDADSTLIITSCYVRVLELFMGGLGAIKGSLAGMTTVSSPSPSARDTLVGLQSTALPTLTASSCSLDGWLLGAAHDARVDGAHTHPESPRRAPHADRLGF